MSLGQEGVGQNSTAENDCSGEAQLSVSLMLLLALFASFVELVQPLALKIVNILLDCTSIEVIPKDQIFLWD